ncbi:MAG: hypothetical protein E6J59_09755 [Deltaproteobacteria bacterium]|nr:MAG: hypothetical protein E6J59_09755 [Deltaproteobacteria bacterium]
MKPLVLAAAVVFATVAVAPDAHGGGYSHGNGSGSCSFTPSTALVGQSFTVNAVGLPTGVEVDLVVTNYEAPTHTYGPLAVNPDGTWSGTFAEPNDGWWNFDFVSPSTNATRLPDRDASCKIRIS